MPARGHSDSACRHQKGGPDQKKDERRGCSSTAGRFLRTWCACIPSPPSVNTVLATHPYTKLCNTFSCIHASTQPSSHMHTNICKNMSSRTCKRSSLSTDIAEYGLQLDSNGQPMAKFTNNVTLNRASGGWIKRFLTVIPCGLTLILCPSTLHSASLLAP